ncbi:MAG: MBL fold metallo-hydrolase [Candidatus Aminicenantes bacterium]|nr:MBL fold metallo-hydrolase [Candidatus Aminicenantes bacterium]
MRYKLIIVGGLETNCYLVYCPGTKECAVVDPGAEAGKVYPVIAEEALRPILLINTHGHIDHIGANRDIKDKYHIPLLIHAGDKDLLGKMQNLEISLFLGAQDSPPADRLIADGEDIYIGNGKLRVLHTPGHTPGGVCLLGDGFLLSGDTLFFEGVGRTDLPGGNQRQLEASIRDKLMVLPDDTVVLPGHGPLTTIGQERAANTYPA